MKLFTVTLTGADESVTAQDLFRISEKFPWVEWGILFSEKLKGKARYPDAPWIKDLLTSFEGVSGQTPGGQRLRFAAHICGSTMRAFRTGITFDRYDNGRWLLPFGISEGEFNRLFGRAQVNFNAKREGITEKDAMEMMAGWYETMDGSLITQHNEANAHIWAACQKEDQTYGSSIRSHHILHDASGGRGKMPSTWDRPISGLLNGYAGGMGPENVIETLNSLEDIAGPGYIWIDMEGKLRNSADAFDLHAIEGMLSDIEEVGHSRGWL
jgi:hypothetical protein